VLKSYGITVIYGSLLTKTALTWHMTVFMWACFWHLFWKCLFFSYTMLPQVLQFYNNYWNHMVWGLRLCSVLSKWFWWYLFLPFHIKLYELKPYSDLHWDCIELGKILAIVSLPIHEHGIFLHLFRSSVISFTSVFVVFSIGILQIFCSFFSFFLFSFLFRFWWYYKW
jgi:hypothetical protein